MAEVYGRVQRITSRPAGKGTAYNLQMDSGDWFGYRFERPNFGEGAEVSFDVDWNGQYGNVRKGSLQIVGGGQQQPQQGGQGGGGYQGNRGGGPRNSGGGQGRGSYSKPKSGGKDNYWDEKAKRDVVVQRQIQHQASRNAAITVIGTALANDAVSLPAKKGDKLDAILALVDEVTDRYDFAVDAVGIAAANGNANPAEPNNVQDDMQQGGYQE